MSEPPPIDYAPPDPGARRRRLIKQIVLIGAAMFVLALGVCAVGLQQARVNVNRVHTASNLRQIGQGILLYATDYPNEYPPNLAAVLRTQQISRYVFVCPGSDDTPATGENMAAIIQDFSRPGRCSFIYVGAGLKQPVDPVTVVAFDSPAHENYDSVVVLRGDGSVNSVSFPMLIQILEDLEAGKNPPSSGTNLSMREAKEIYNRKWRDRMPRMQIEGWRVPATRPAE